MNRLGPASSAEPVARSLLLCPKGRSRRHGPAPLPHRATSGRFRRPSADARGAKTDLHSAFDQVCARLNPVPDQTVVLSVLNDTEVVYIGRRPGSRAVGVNYELGMRLPANCTASGKALLSTLEPDRVRDLYSEFEPDGLPILTKRSIKRTLSARAGADREGRARLCARR